MTTSDLRKALLACAAGFYPHEAGVGLLITHASFLDRSDFTGRFIRHGVSITDGSTNMAQIDWTAAITALGAGELPCSGSERRILRLAASIAAGIPVDLCDTLTGLDRQNIQRLINAIRHASGHTANPDPVTVPRPLLPDLGTNKSYDLVQRRQRLRVREHLGGAEGPGMVLSGRL